MRVPRPLPHRSDMRQCVRKTCIHQRELTRVLRLSGRLDTLVATGIADDSSIFEYQQIGRDVAQYAYQPEQ
jgi:hypothetical protein